MTTGTERRLNEVDQLRIAPLLKSEIVAAICQPVTFEDAAMAARVAANIDKQVLREFIAEATMPDFATYSYGVIPAILVMPIFATAKPDWSSPRSLATYVEKLMTAKGRGGVRYVGPQLYQQHKTVLLGLAHIQRGAKVNELKGNRALEGFSPRWFLRQIGWGDNARNLDTLRVVLGDLKHATLTLWTKNQDECDGMEFSIVADRTTPRKGRWAAQLSTSALALFQGNLTYLSIRSRQCLSDGFQTFVFDYLRATGYKLPFQWLKLMAASGTTGTCLENFKDSCKVALLKLRDEGMIGDFECDRAGFRVWGPAEQKG